MGESDGSIDNDVPFSDETPLTSPAQARHAAAASVEPTHRSDARQHEPFVRTPTPHRTQPPVNDLDDDLYSSEYTHDSSYVNHKGSPLASGAYRRSRNEMPQLQKQLHYGQYLEMPKGRRSIFASREMQRRHRGIVVAVVVLVVLVLVAIILWNALH
jgi:hypothetical protein